MVSSIWRQMAQVPRRRPCWQRSAAVRARALRAGVRVARGVERAVAVLPNPFTAFVSSGPAQTRTEVRGTAGRLQRRHGFILY